ncbi:MAG TPA: hypothetical protein VM755_06310 [Stellaceae bacterium]|nr:hypothetical protein [Stellaceae bacterium]
MTLKGHYKTSEFVVSSDKKGGTEIKIGKPKGAIPVFVYADPGTRGGSASAPEAFAGGADGGGSNGFTPFGPGAAAPVLGSSDGLSLLPWATDPFHFWTIQG